MIVTSLRPSQSPPHGSGGDRPDPLDPADVTAVALVSERQIGEMDVLHDAGRPHTGRRTGPLRAGDGPFERARLLIRRVFRVLGIGPVHRVGGVRAGTGAVRRHGGVAAEQGENLVGSGEQPERFGATDLDRVQSPAGGDRVNG
ncbi:MAG: hypothetical protein ACR2LI_01120 [Propionibacteriaceae bacterium]